MVGEQSAVNTDKQSVSPYNVTTLSNMLFDE